MRGNSFGKILSMTSFGESHGKALGVIIDGVPPNLPFCKDDLQIQLNKRAPGRIEGTTSRVEPDKAEVLSGIFNGKTLGTPIAVIIYNKNQKSEDYTDFKNSFRVGHADKTTIQKFGIRDHRGGGRASGRETLSRVIGGYFASLIIPEVFVKGYITKLGPFSYKNNIPKNYTQDLGPYYYPDIKKHDDIKNYLLYLKENGDSCGGKLSLIIDNCPHGLGEPVFDKLKADFSKALMSIGGCTSFSFGLGEDFSNISGKDASSNSNVFGGIEGGISNGQQILLNATFKPPSTVGEKAKQGRHDPAIIIRAVVVAEAMVRFVIADHFLRQQAYKL